MKLTPINSYKTNTYNNRKISFKAINFVEYNAQYNNSKSLLQEELNKFAKTTKHANYIGAGINAKAYILQKLPNLVIKEAFDKTENFKLEAENLRNIMNNYTTSQKFVARAYDDQTNNYILVTTKVSGLSPNPNDAPLTQLHLKNLFNELYELDTKSIYHGDLNLGNIKLSADGSVNFLDYQWTQNIGHIHLFEENSSISHPTFLLCENAQMFEMAGLPYYIKQIEGHKEKEKFFINYLKEKSIYHKKRAQFIEKQLENWPYSNEINDLKKAIKFEYAKAKLFENPSDDIRNIEILKIQFLNITRQIYKFIDKNIKDKNILQGASAHLYALLQLQEFQYCLNKYEKNTSYSYKQDYLAGLQEFSNYWYNNIKSWAKDAYSFPVRHINEDLQYWENSLYDFKCTDIDYGSFKDIDKFSEVLPLTQKLIPTTPTLSEYQKYQNHIQNLNNIYFTSLFANSSLYSYTNKLKNLNKNIQQQNNENKALNLLNSVIYGMLLSKQAEDAITYKINNAQSFVNLASLTLIKSSLKNLKNIYKDFSYDIFNNVCKEIDIAKKYNYILPYSVKENNNIFS